MENSLLKENLSFNDHNQLLSTKFDLIDLYHLSEIKIDQDLDHL